MSTFESGNEGWRVVQVAGDDYVVAEGPFVPQLVAGGNPGGAIRFQDRPTYLYLFQAPATFLGNQASSYGLRLWYDLKTSGTGDPFGAYDIVLTAESGKRLYTKTGATFFAQWTTYNAVLKEGPNWFIHSGGWREPTKEEFLDVLAHLAGVWIRGEFLNGTNERTDLDNVRLEKPTPPLLIAVSEVRISWLAEQGVGYRLESRLSVPGQNWAPTGAAILGQGATVEQLFKIAPDEPTRFWRALSLP